MFLVKLISTVMLLGFALAVAAHGQGDKPAEAWRSEPVDPTKYGGWQKIELRNFSFYAPSDAKGCKLQGGDTAVYHDTAVYCFKSPKLEISFDFGRTASPPPRSTKVKTFTIDGRDAAFWFSHGQTLANLYIDYDYKGNAGFKVYVVALDADPEITEKIIRSLRFNNAPEH